MTGLSTQTEEKLRDAARDWPALEVLLVFGSGAHGDLKDSSDLDLFVRLVRGQRRDRDAELRFKETAERAAKREIDLIVEGPETSVLLRREVAAKGRVLFERTTGASRQLVVDAVRDYIDLEPYLAKIGAAIRARAIARGVEAKQRLAGRAVPHGG